MGFWSNRLNEFNWGHFLISKVVFLLNLVIALKIFDAPLWVYFVAPVIMLVLIMLIGILFDKYMRKYYVDAHYKDTGLMK